MFSATDWALKRVLKFLLKKSVGRFLHSEPDLEQLDVQLSSGTFELRNVLLNCKAVNDQLAIEGWQVTAGYVGVVRGSLPLTATGAAAAAAGSAAAGATADINANLTLDEVLITVAPTAAAAADATTAAVGGLSSGTAAAAAAPGTDAYAAEQQQQQTFADDLGMLGQLGVFEGIKLIAGGLEAVLQRLSVAATNVTIRVEVPALAAAAAAGGGANSAGAGIEASAAAAAALAGVSAATGAELILHLDCVHYSDATPAQPPAAPAAAGGSSPGTAAAAAAAEQPALTLVELVKRVSVTGLTVELLQLPEDDNKGSAAAAAGTSQALRCSQLLYDGASDVAATAAALRGSFMARSSMMRSSFMTASAAGADSFATAGEGPTAAAGAGAGIEGAGPAPDLGGLLLGGPNAIGLDFNLELRLAWSTATAAAAGGSSTQPPRITADVNSSAVAVYLQPWQLPLMQLCSAAASNGSSSSSSSSKNGVGASIPPTAAAASSGGAYSQQQQQPWGQRSFVEELFFPHVEGFVADSLNLSSPARGLNWGPGSGLYNSVALGDGSSGSTVLGGIFSGSSSSAAANAASGMYSMYHDARSVFSSVANSISGAMSGNILSGIYSVPNTTQSGSSSSPQGLLGSPTMYSSSSRVGGTASGAAGGRSIWQQQPQQPPSLPEAAWSVRAVCPAVHVCCHYHAPACVGAAGAPAAGAAGGAAAEVLSPKSRLQQQQQQAQPPCFVLQCGGLCAAYDVSGRASHVSVKLYQLEAYELLPGDWCVVAGAINSSSSSDGLILHPKVLGSVPRVLPAAQGSAGFTQQVPAWSSAATSSAPGGVGLLTWPVLLLGGVPLDPDRTLPAVHRPSCTLKASAHRAERHSSRLSKAAVDCELQPLTLWLTAGLAQRLSSITALMQHSPAAAAAAGGGAGGGGGGGGGAGVGVGGGARLSSPQQRQQQWVQSAAVQQQPQQQLPAVLQGADISAAVHATRLCVVLPLVHVPANVAAAGGGTGSSTLPTAGAVGSPAPQCMFVAVELHSGSSSSSSSSGTYAAAAAGQHHHHHHQGQPRHGHVGGHSHDRQPIVLRAAAAAASGRTLPLLQMTSSPPPAVAAAAAAGSAGVFHHYYHHHQQQQQGAVLELCLTRLRFFQVTQVPQPAGGSSSSSTLAAAASRAAAAAAAASKASGSTSSSMLLQQQQQGYSLSRLLRRQQQKQPGSDAGGVAAGSSSSHGSSMKLSASCILDAGPATAPPPLGLPPAAVTPGPGPLSMGASSSSGDSSGHSSMASSGVAAAGLGFGPDDVPWGLAVFATVTWDPSARPDPAAVAEAAALAAAHAKDRGEGMDDDCDTYYAGYDTTWPPTPPAAAEGAGGRGAQVAGQGGKAAAGCSSQFGVLKFQHKCQKGSLIVVHARAPAVAGFVCRDELAALIRGAVTAAASSAQSGKASGGSPPAAASVQPQLQQQQSAGAQQVAVLLQCRLHLCLQTIPQQHLPQSAHHGSHKHSYHAQHSHHQQPAGQGLQHAGKPSNSSHNQVLGPSSLIELLADDLTYFIVKGLGGKSAAAATCLCIQGLQLYTVGSSSKGISTSGAGSANSSGGTGSSRICALLVPKHSKTTGPPGLELLQVVTGSTSFSNSSSASAHSTVRQGFSSSNAASSRQAGSREGKQAKHVTYAPSGAATTAGKDAAASQDMMSVLLRGATLSMDAGGLSLDWSEHLTQFFGPIIAAAAAGAQPAAVASTAAGDASTAGSMHAHDSKGGQHKQQGSSIQQQQQQCSRDNQLQQQQVLVFNLQDFAVRCEPRNDAPASHNSSRMAAALVLDGAHWRMHPGPCAPQHLLLHSLGFYVAAAAARSVLTPGACSGGSSAAGHHSSGSRTKGGKGLGVWDPAVPVDLHGFSLSAAGYHCIAQEGGLGVIVRPAAAAGVAGGSTGTSTLEIEVTNTHLTGSLRKDTAVLAIQLMNQWAAHALLRNPPRPAGSTSSSASTSSLNSPVSSSGCSPEPPKSSTNRSSSSKGAGANAASGSGSASKQRRQEAAVESEVLAALQEDAFRNLSQRTSRSNSSAQLSAAGGTDAPVQEQIAAPPGRTHAPAAGAGDGANRTGQLGAAASLQSSVFLSGGWYAKQQQREGPAAANPWTASTRSSGPLAEEDLQQDAWGMSDAIAGYDTKRPMGTASSAESPDAPAAAAAGAAVAAPAASEGALGTTNSSSAGSASSSQLFPPVLDERVLAASILAALPPGAAAGDADVVVLLDDYIQNPEEDADESSEQGFDFGQQGFAHSGDGWDGSWSDEEYDIISPRAAANAAIEAAAAAARAERIRRRRAAMAAAAAGTLDPSASGYCPEQGVWYAPGAVGGVSGQAMLSPNARQAGVVTPGSAVSGDTAGAAASSPSETGAGMVGPLAPSPWASQASPTRASSASASAEVSPVGVQAAQPTQQRQSQQQSPVGGISSTGGEKPPVVLAQANSSTGASQGARDAAAGPGAAAAAAAAGTATATAAAPSTGQLPPLLLQEDYLAPVSPSSNEGLVTPSNVSAAVAMAGFDSGRTPRGFVSPWARVLSHSIFQHLLPLDPDTPWPISRFVCRGLSGMFVLHDKGAVPVASSSNHGRSSSMRNISSGSGGRLELEVDGVSLSMEVYPPGHCQVSRLVVAVGSLEIRDCLGTATAAAASTAAGAGGGRSISAAAAAAAAAASAAASAAAAGQGPRGVAAAAAGAATGRNSSGKKNSGKGAAAYTAAGAGRGSFRRGTGGGVTCSKVLSVRRPGTQGGASISRSLAASRASSLSSPASNKHTHSAASSPLPMASVGSLPTPMQSPSGVVDHQPFVPEDLYLQQQLPPLLLGGMLQGWPAAVLAPDSLLPAAAVVLETVRPEPQGPPESDEYRLGVALLPIRLRLNQDLVSFLVVFFGSVADAVAAVENPLAAAVAATSAAAAGTGAEGSSGGVAAAVPASSGVQPPFFQKVVIWGTGVCVHYCPRRVDIAALRDGDFLELLNLVPWGGVDLTLKPLRFTGVVGWDGLAAGLASEWLGYVAKTQAHKFLAGVAPIRSVIKVSSAVATLLSGPASSLQKAVGGAVTAAAAAGKAGAAAMWQQGGSNGMNGLSARQQLQACLQAAAAAAAAAAGSSSTGAPYSVSGRQGYQDTMAVSVQSFARALLYEAMGVGASVASGAQALLVKPSSAAPSGLVQGIRAAASGVQAGFQEAAAVLAQGSGAQIKQGDYVTAAREVLRAAPAAAAAPVRGFAAGVRTALRSQAGAVPVSASPIDAAVDEQEQD